MTIEMARALLQLPEKYTRAQLDESYRQLRLLYEPRCYGRPNEFFDQHILEHMYRYVSGKGYKPAKGVQYQHIPLDNYGSAFLSYAKVCLAYDVLTDPKNVEARKQREQKSFETHLETARDIATFFAIPLLVLFFVFGLVGTFGDVRFCEVLSGIFLTGFVVARLIQWLSQPLDTLLFIPKRIWNGVREAATKGGWLTKPIRIVLNAALYGVGGLLGLVFFPLLISDDREERLGSREWIISRDRKGADEWYRKTRQNLQMLSAACGDGVVSARMTYVRKTLESTAAVCRETRKEMEKTIEQGKREVRKAEKRYDQRTSEWGTLGMDGWEYELEVYYAGQAWDKDVKQEQKAVDEMRDIYTLAFRSFCMIANRLGVDPADYEIDLSRVKSDVTYAAYEGL